MLLVLNAQAHWYWYTNKTFRATRHSLSGVQVELEAHPKVKMYKTVFDTVTGHDWHKRVCIHWMFCLLSLFLCKCLKFCFCQMDNCVFYFVTHISKALSYKVIKTTNRKDMWAQPSSLLSGRLKKWYYLVINDVKNTFLNGEKELQASLSGQSTCLAHSRPYILWTSLLKIKTRGWSRGTVIPPSLCFLALGYTGNQEQSWTTMILS